MIIAMVILLIMWSIPMILYIIWRRGDWYLFLFPMLFSFVICAALSVISDILSIVFALMVVAYAIYGFTKKE